MNTDGLLSPSDIAELAGVSRAAVSNWRNRFPDFPQRADGTDARPLFDRVQVTDWLFAQGKTVRESSALQVWSAVNALRPFASLDELVLEAHRLIAVRHLADQGDEAAIKLWATLTDPRAVSNVGAMHFGKALHSILDETISYASRRPFFDELAAPGLAALAATIASVDPTTLLNTSSLLLERAGAEAARAGSSFGLVSSRTAALLAAAASTITAATVYDPAAGIAEAAQVIAARNLGYTTLIGADVNADAILIAAVRARLRGLTASYYLADILQNDPHPDLLADIVVAEPPFGLRWETAGAINDRRWEFGIPPRNSADLAWIQHVLAHLTPTGRGYVITPRGPLHRGGQEGRIRAGIIKRDLVRAIVGLPGRMLPNASLPLTLWVLGEPSGPIETDTVLVIDASDRENPEQDIPAWLTGEVGDVPHKRVSITDILAADSVLTPARWVGAQLDTPTRSEVGSAFSRVGKARSDIANMPEPTLPSGDAPPRLLRLSELIEHGAVSMTAGRIAAGDANEAEIVRPADIRQGFHASAESPVSDTQERRTAAGDVLVTRFPKLSARVDREGGRIPVRGVYILTPRPEELDPDYLAHCVAGSWNEALQTSAHLLSVKDIEIPMVPLDQQRAIAEQLRQLDQFVDSARELKKASVRAGDQLMTFIRYGTPQTGAQ